MNNSVYDKTDKGREEIATRKYQIPARVRTLLVLVDGRRPLDALLSNVAGLGLTAQNIEQLLEQDFIRLVPGSAPAAEPAALAPAAASTPASARARAMARQAVRAAAAPVPVLTDTIAAALDDTVPAPLAADAAEQFRQLYAFYNRSIKAAVGLRGVMLQLKVEKAVGVEELRELRTPFLQAVIKAKGVEAATAMRDELDGLLGGAPEHDTVDMPAANKAGRGLDFFNMSSGAVEY